MIELLNRSEAGVEIFFGGGVRVMERGYRFAIFLHFEGGIINSSIYAVCRIAGPLGEG